jgi:flagellar FliJ protein
MMTFKFKLEALRQYRNYQEDLMQKELTQAQRLKDKEFALLEGLTDQRCQAEQQLGAMQEKSTNGPHMALYDQYLKRITREIAAQRQRLKDAEALCKEKMGQLLVAMQNRKTIDKLKEKDLRAYIDTLNQNEQKFINEIAINQFARNNM